MESPEAEEKKREEKEKKGGKKRRFSLLFRDPPSISGSLNRVKLPLGLIKGKARA